MNHERVKPPLWMIVFISGLPLFSETVYSQSLPEIAKYFMCSNNLAEHTMSIYFVGFALGMLLWGKLADRFGRRMGIISGFGVYLVGCVGCFIAPTISWFMAARFIQAFGACVGSVLGQTLSRDAFTGKELVRAYAAVGAALAVFPALGPIVGGYIAHAFFWKMIFLFLIAVAVGVIGIVYFFLPETLHHEHRLNVSMVRLSKKMVQDKMIIGLGLLIAAVNGMRFSYFAEAPFYFMEILQMDPWWYTKSFIGISIAGVLAGMFCHRMHVRYSSYELMRMGICIALFFVGILLGFAMSAHWILYSSTLYIAVSLLCVVGAMFGLGIVTTIALPMALIDYRKVQGTASALFGFYYYLCTSVFNFGMGYLHNDTLLIMPLYFFMIIISMIFVFYMFIQNRIDHDVVE